MTDFPVLPSDVLVDVTVIGGGFVRKAAGYLLKQAGLKVAAIEARRVVQGVTGYTTAKLTSLHRPSTSIYWIPSVTNRLDNMAKLMRQPLIKLRY
jgi:glycine/D-amino acid oxidase-like deaminating enzyme